MSMNRRTAAALLLLTCFAREAPAQVTREVLLLTGGSVPGTGMVLDAVLGEPRLTPDGQLALHASLTSGGVTSAGVLQGRAGAWRVVLRRNQPAPGLSGATVGPLTTGLLVQADSGRVLISGDTLPAGGGSPLATIWAEDSGGLRVVAMQGTAAAAAPGFQWTSSVGGALRRTFSNAGDVGLSTQVQLTAGQPDSPAGTYESLWSGSPSDVRLRWRARQPPPGINNSNPNESGWLLGYSRFEDLQHAADGRLQFFGQVWLNATQAWQGEGIWEWMPPFETTLRNYGPVAVSPPGGGTAAAFSLRGSAGNGRVLLQQTMQRTAPQNPYGALFVSGPGPGMALEHFAGGAPVPGLPDAEVTPLGTHSALCAAGLAASLVEAPSTNQPHPTIPNVTFRGYALMFGRPGAASVIAANQVQAPGLPAGVRFRLNSDAGILTSSVPWLALTPQGRLLFLSQLQGTGVTTANRKALWLAQPGGQPVLVLRTGDSIPEAGGRVLADFSVVMTGSGDDGKPRGHNDAGQVAVWADFTSGPDALMLVSAGATVPANPLPALNVARGTGGNLVLTWTTAQTGLVVESSASLAAGTWSAVSDPLPSRNGDTWTLTLLAPPGPPRFYRLRRP